MIPATTRATDAIRKTVAGSFKITMPITAPPSVDRREAKRLSLVPKKRRRLNRNQDDALRSCFCAFPDGGWWRGAINRTLRLETL